jgi:hypothetical protein
LFRARKIELGRDDLIFPILYIDVPALEDEAQRRRNNVLEMIQARQYADWTALRWQSADSSEFGKEIGRYCRSIRDALNRPWVSPEERLREAEAKARQQAEDAAQDKGRSNEPRGPRNAEDVVQPRKLRRTPRDAPKVTLKQRLVADAKGRPKESLAAKHEQMRESVWNFFRSDPALLYSKISPEELSLAPAGWLAGALHLESFGSYVSDTGLILFDVLDLDDAILAPCTWDLLHFCVSVLIAADTMLIQMSTARKIAQTLLKSFSRTLAEGETGMELRVEPNSTPPISSIRFFAPSIAATTRSITRNEFGLTKGNGFKFVSTKTAQLSFPKRRRPILSASLIEFPETTMYCKASRFMTRHHVGSAFVGLVGLAIYLLGSTRPMPVSRF